MKNSRISPISKIVITAAILSVSMGLTGCSLLPQQNPLNTTPNPDEHKTDVFNISVGDCLNDTAGTTVTDVPQVDCSVPHDYEVFYDFKLSGSDYPGDTKVGEDATDGCKAAFAGFVGISYDDSAFVISNYNPTRDSWENANDRTVSCLIGEEDAKVTGTLKGAAR